MEKDRAPARATFGAAGIAAACLLGAWCGPALAASGIDCDAADARFDSATTVAAPALAAHTDPALADVLDDDAVALPAAADARPDDAIDATEASDAPDADGAKTIDTPAFITRLPGVSDAVLPSFRRQMHRTDI